jgi:hypothetical protein
MGIDQVLPLASNVEQAAPMSDKLKFVADWTWTRINNPTTNRRLSDILIGITHGLLLASNVEQAPPRSDKL